MRWIFVALATVACRDGSTSPPAAPDPAPARALAHSDAGARSPGPRPELVAEPQDAAGDDQRGIEQTYEHEPVDRVWKASTEAELHRRVPAASAIECHATICTLTLVGNERDLGKQIDALATEASVRGIAGSILLTAPDKRPDGTTAVRAYAQFDRPQ